MTLRFFSLMAAAAMLPASLIAEEDALERAKAERLQSMKRILGEYELRFADATARPLTHTKEPVVRFSNPVRDSFSDGAVFFWLSDSRPVAAASLWIRGNGDRGRDFCSMSDKPLVATRNGRVEWSPRKGILVNLPLPNAPPPGQTPQQRLIQMRQLARRFSADIGAWPAEGFRKLRLMPRPIYRYTSEPHDVIDGAVFALALANDPEVLVRLELARQENGGSAWGYSLARMSALRMKVRLDDRESWSTNGYYRGPRSPNDPYIEQIDEGASSPAADGN